MYKPVLSLNTYILMRSLYGYVKINYCKERNEAVMTSSSPDNYTTTSLISDTVTDKTSQILYIYILYKCIQ